MKKIKYLLFLIPFLFSLNVYATNYNVSSKIKYNVSLPGGSYGSDDLTDGYNTVMGRYNVGTRYNGRVGYMEFFVSGDDFNATTNHTYTITLNMATNDWRNNFMGPIVYKCNSDGSEQSTNSHLIVSNFRFISRKQIKFNFKTNSSLSPYYKFIIYSYDYANKGGTAITGETNWNLSSIYINDNVSSGGSSGGSSSTPTPTPSPGNEDIINNNNQNTQNIIDNSTQNTSDIIDNANQNSQDIINNQNSNTDKINDTINSGLNNKCSNLFDPDKVSVCRFDNDTDYLTGCDTTINDKNSKEGYVQYSTTSNWQGWHTDYIPVSANKTYYLNFINNNYSNNVNVCLKINIYRSDKVFMLQNQYCTSSNNVSRTVMTPYNGAYVRISMEASEPISWNTYAKISFSTSETYCVFGSTSSKLDDIGQSVINGAQSIIDNVNNGNQQINDNLDDIKDSLTDETTPEIDLDLNLDTSSPVSDLLTMPLTILNKIFNITDDTCEPYVLPFDFSGGNNTIIFPCINLRDFLGNTVYNVLDTILCFYLCYQIGMMCISIYEDITSLRDGFYGLYTPKHHDTSTRVGRGELEGKY